jgi:hypothetical protein
MTDTKLNSVVRVKMRDLRKEAIQEVATWVRESLSFGEDFANAIEDEFLEEEHSHIPSCSWRTCKGECYELKE